MCHFISVKCIFNVLICIFGLILDFGRYSKHLSLYLCVFNIVPGNQSVFPRRLLVPDPVYQRLTDGCGVGDRRPWGRPTTPCPHKPWPPLWGWPPATPPRPGWPGANHGPRSSTTREEEKYSKRKTASYEESSVCVVSLSSLHSLVPL